MSDLIERMQKYIDDISGWQDADALFKEAIETIEKLKQELDYHKQKAEYYRSGLNQIVQMERYPNESGSDVYDGIYPTGKFAVKVLKEEFGK